MGFRHNVANGGLAFLAALCHILAVIVVVVDCHAPTEFLKKLREREKELNLQPDYALESYLKATSVQGKRQNAVTEFIMRVLGLEVATL